MLFEIKTEVGARIGVLATGASAAVPWLDQVSSYLKVASIAMGILVGIPTFAYYTLLAVEKWRAMRPK
jgi:hypothetical protein